MKDIVGCPLEKAKAVQIDKALWKEMEELAAANPAEGFKDVWGEKEMFIMETYYSITTTPAVLKMLLKVKPDVDWSCDKIRSKGRRMGLKKEIMK